jgi:predicted small secreted protein
MIHGDAVKQVPIYTKNRFSSHSRRLREKLLRENLKRKTLLLCASILVVFAVEGCATMRGMGEDIQSLGRAIQRLFSGG